LGRLHTLLRLDDGLLELDRFLRRRTRILQGKEVLVVFVLSVEFEVKLERCVRRWTMLLLLLVTWLLELELVVRVRTVVVVLWLKMIPEHDRPPLARMAQHGDEPVSLQPARSSEMRSRIGFDLSPKTCRQSRREKANGLLLERIEEEEELLPH